MSDSFAKTTRSFVCRDTLWETLSEVAAELECIRFAFLRPGERI